MIAPHLREYWYLRTYEPGEAGYSYWGDDGWTSSRGDAAELSQARAHDIRDRSHYVKSISIFHVTVTTVPKGQRAAWERVVRAAVAMCDAFEAGKRSLDPGVAVAALSITDLGKAADSLGSHRPESK